MSWRRSPACGRSPVNEQAFNLLLLSALRRAQIYARSLAKSRDLGEDLAQEACSRALRFRASFKEGTNFEAWLTIIVRNTWHEWTRREARRPSAPLELAEGNAGEDLRRHADVMHMRSSFLSLPQGERRTLLRIGAGMDYEEAEPGVNLGTVKSRISRARAKL